MAFNPRAFNPAWNAEASQARSASGNGSAPCGDLTTFVAVALDDRGHLIEVYATKTSGVDFFDRAAIEAVRKAEPFLNPPRGLTDTSGKIHFSFAITDKLCARRAFQP